MYKIEKDNLVELINYLSTKPYGEVYLLLEKLTKLKEITTKK